LNQTHSTLRGVAKTRRRLRPGALLVVRTAHGLKTLLYPEVGPESLAGLEPQVAIRPFNEVINSVIIAEKPEGGR
jgi:nicotianamine synthase